VTISSSVRVFGVFLSFLSDMMGLLLAVIRNRSAKYTNRVVAPAHFATCAIAMATYPDRAGNDRTVWTEPRGRRTLWVRFPE
jgi:hypothetical protein